uniref:Uncharacterized protein n=1 Tax=Panagrolaimus sp. JU765 TaxID=591449 RepID=A0AC34RD66_9BILA
MDLPLLEDKILELQMCLHAHVPFQSVVAEIVSKRLGRVHDLSNDPRYREEPMAKFVVEDDVAEIRRRITELDLDVAVHVQMDHIAQQIGEIAGSILED